MSKIDYDPVKNSLSGIIKGSKALRRIFYFILDIIFLRSWHIRRILLEKGQKLDHKGNWKLLDAGCGFGQYDHFLLRNFQNIRITSVDIKEDYLEENGLFFKDEIKRGRVSFENANLLEFCPDEKFDFLICIDVLEHIEEDVKVIRNLSDSLKRDGLFLMHSPSHYSVTDAGDEDTFVGEHARTGYSKDEIENKLVECDLLPLKTHYTYGYWGRLSWILSVKWPMLWLNNINYFALLPLTFYYPVVMPFCLLMNLSDLYTKNERGNGIYCLAKKV